MQVMQSSVPSSVFSSYALPSYGTPQNVIHVAERRSNPAIRCVIPWHLTITGFASKNLYLFSLSWIDIATTKTLEIKGTNEPA